MSQRFACLPLLILIISMPGSVSAYQQARQAFTLVSLDASLVDPAQMKARIQFSAAVVASGNVSVGLVVPQSIKVLPSQIETNLGKMIDGSRVQRTWDIILPSEGYHLLEVGLSFVPENDLEEGGDRFVNYHSFPLYIHTRNGQIETQAHSQDLKLAQAPSKAGFRKTGNLLATQVPMDQRGAAAQGKTGPPDDRIASVDVYIAGRVYYQLDFPLRTKGVPDVRVELDWDDDNDPTSLMTPYPINNDQHVGYDKTDMNGYYYFSFTLATNQPASVLVSPGTHIRVHVRSSNSATFNGDLDVGIGAEFTTYPSIDISQATTEVSASSVDLMVEAAHGSALRYLYRAELFALALSPSDFSDDFTTLNAIRYYSRPGSGRSYFSTGAGNFWWWSWRCTPAPEACPDVPYIVFSAIPEAQIGYHEFGHFVDYLNQNNGYDDLISDHWLTLQTNSQTAWAEGFAAFFNAAAHAYWYRLEQPSVTEFDNRERGACLIPTTQFLDYTQSCLPAGQDNTKVEGAVACFLYSLWDKTAVRGPFPPVYQGDNDDLQVSGPFIFSAIRSWFPEIFSMSQIEAFRNSCLNQLPSTSPRRASVDALYNAIVNRTGNARPATASQVQVILLPESGIQREIMWTDNTCPSQVSYYEEAVGEYNIIHNWTYYLDENQEQGFHIWRKPTTPTAVWDSTLSGYSLAGTSTSSYNFVETTPLLGTHSYVVTAFNGGGDAAPFSETKATYAPVVQVSLPSGGEVLPLGANVAVQWASNAYSTASIELSNNGWQSFYTPALHIPNTGSHTLVGVTGPLGPYQLRVKIYDLADPYTYVSDTSPNFTLWGIVDGSIQHSVMTFCDGGSAKLNLNVTWLTNVATAPQDVLSAYSPSASNCSGQALATAYGNPSNGGTSHAVTLQAPCATGWWKYVVKSWKGSTGDQVQSACLLVYVNACPTCSHSQCPPEGCQLE